MHRSNSIQKPLLFVSLAWLLSFSAIGDNLKKDATFNKDVAPIFYKSCTGCHRPGEVAPMSLLSYKEARPWARAIREKVISKEMPPWHADPAVSEFSNDRRLTSQEIETIVAWVDTGAREGKTPAPPQPTIHSDDWTIGKPDLVLEMPEEVVLNKASADEYHYIELPANLTEDRYVEMAQLLPSNHKVAHHITAFVIPPMGFGAQLTKEQIDKIRKEMEKGSIFYYDGELSRVKPQAPVYDDGCELPSGGSATSWNGSGPNWTAFAKPLVIYSPGVNPVVFRPGTAKKIPAGSKILLQAHYWKSEGKIERDRTRLGLVFAKTPPAKEVQTELLINNYFKIPAGASHHRVTACWTPKQDVRLISFMPHMHWRGVSMTLEAIGSDGRSQQLLSVSRYNFSWQTTYYLKNPVVIPKGTRLMITAYFNNSTANRLNPDPKRDIRAGEPTADEMMACFVNYTIEKTEMADPTGKN